MLNHNDIHQLFKEHAEPAPGIFLYGLADHAGMPGLVKKLAGSKMKWISLFEGSKEENAFAVAPLLFQIKADQTGIQHRTTIDWIGEHGTYTSSLLLLTSVLPLYELKRRLAVRLDAVLPDDVNIMLRFFDPRIFEQLMRVLSHQQKQSFLSVGDNWWFADRRGDLQRIESSFSSTDLFESPLYLNTEQESYLIEASEPDQIAQLLQSTVPNEYQLLPLPEQHAFITRHMAAAQQIGIKATHELAFYCALALLYGDAFATQPDWHKILQEDVLTGKISLKEAAEQIESNAMNLQNE